MRDQKDDKGDDIHRHRCPYPGHQLFVAMEAFEQIFKGCNMDRLRIILFKDLSKEKEEVEKHSIGDQFGDLEEGLIFNFYSGCGDPSNDLEDNDDDRRP